MRNNEERLGIQNPSTDTFVEQDVKQEINYPVQTEFVDLPTKGKFYSEDHPLYQKDSIEIKFMTSHEEDLLTSKSLIKKGVVIDRLLQSLLVNKKIDINSLFISDKNALIIAARISGYGEEYNTKVLCPSCEESIEYSFNLSKINVFYGDSSKLDDNGLLTFELPKTKSKIICRLLTGKDEKYLSQVIESKKKSKLQETNTTDQMKLYVVSVNGNTDQRDVHKFIDTMPSFDSRFLRKSYRSAVPNMDLNQTVECPNCDSESEVMMPLGTTFFWPE